MTTSRSRQPDLVILDEHLVFPANSLRGSQLAVRLRQHGYAGFICICSGDSLSSFTELVQSGLVNLVLIKGAVITSDRLLVAPPMAPLMASLMAPLGAVECR